MADDLLARPLPHNLDAERSVLGSILINESYLPTVLEKITPNDFFLAEHRRILAHMISLREEQKPIDSLTLIERIYQHGDIEKAGGRGYISALGDGVPRVSNVSHYAAIVKEKSLLRILIHSAAAIQNQAMLGEEDAGVILERAETSIQQVVRHRANGASKLPCLTGPFSYGLMEFLTAQFPVPEHLVEGLIPRGGSILMFALPHRLKSWLTTALALAASVPGIALGQLEVKKAVRTLLIQVEDFPGQLQWRMQQLLATQTFSGADSKNVRIVPRCGLNLPDPVWYQRLYREVQEFHADHVVFDVVRRIFRGDVNSPKDTAAFLEAIDELREATECAVTLVHHSNKKDAEIMTAAAGSYNFPGWANVVVEFKRKTQDGAITHVELEVDNKLAQSPEPMRMVLDLGSQIPVRLEPLEDTLGIMEAQERLGADWTIRDLAEVLDVHKSNAARRLKKWLSSGTAEKLTSGRRGRTGGLARYHFPGFDKTDSPADR